MKEFTFLSSLIFIGFFLSYVLGLVATYKVFKRANVNFVFFFIGAIPLVGGMIFYWKVKELEKGN